MAPRPLWKSSAKAVPAPRFPVYSKKKSLSSTAAQSRHVIFTPLDRRPGEFIITIFLVINTVVVRLASLRCRDESWLCTILKVLARMRAQSQAVHALQYYGEVFVGTPPQKFLVTPYHEIRTRLAARTWII